MIVGCSLTGSSYERNPLQKAIAATTVELVVVVVDGRGPLSCT